MERVTLTFRFGGVDRPKARTYRQDAHCHQVEGGTPFGSGFQTTREVSDRNIIVVHYVPSG